MIISILLLLLVMGVFFGPVINLIGYLLDDRREYKFNWYVFIGERAFHAHAERR